MLLVPNQSPLIHRTHSRLLVDTIVCASQNCTQLCRRHPEPMRFNPNYHRKTTNIRSRFGSTHRRHCTAYTAAVPTRRLLLFLTVELIRWLGLALRGWRGPRIEYPVLSLASAAIRIRGLEASPLTSMEHSQFPTSWKLGPSQRACLRSW